jgi:hypothetical protein
MSSVDVLEMLRPVRAKRVDQLEELAGKILAGEKIPAEIIDAKLVEARKEPADLQRIIDRKTRAASLVSLAKAGAPAEKRLAKIEGEIAAVREEYDLARAKLLAVQEKHAGEQAKLTDSVQAAARARDQLLSQECLPLVAWDKLAAAERAADEAENTFQSAQRQLPEFTKALNEAERAVRRARDGDDLVKQDGEWLTLADVEQRAKKAKAAFDRHEASIPTLEAAWKKRCKERDATRVEILAEFGL